MTPESEKNLRLEIGHVLFIDIVGYSKGLINEQSESLRQMIKAVPTNVSEKRLARRSDAAVNPTRTTHG
jgi:hypothetical protein